MHPCAISLLLMRSSTLFFCPDNKPADNQPIDKNRCYKIGYTLMGNSGSSFTSCVEHHIARYQATGRRNDRERCRADARRHGAGVDWYCSVKGEKENI